MLLKFFSLYFLLSFLFPNDGYMINEIANKSGIYYSKVNEDLLITGDIYSYFDGREVYNGFISEGYKIGKWIDYYINGIKRSEFMYKNGLMNGPYTLWYKNGVKGEYGFHKNNKKDKLIIKWDQKGQKLSSVTFKEDLFHGEVIFFNSDGSVKYSGIYKEGRCVHGTKKSYRHKNNFPNPVYEIFKDGKLVKLKWLDNEDKILETVDCIKTNCN